MTLHEMSHAVTNDNRCVGRLVAACRQEEEEEEEEEEEGGTGGRGGLGGNDGGGGGGVSGKVVVVVVRRARWLQVTHALTQRRVSRGHRALKTTPCTFKMVATTIHRSFINNSA